MKVLYTTEARVDLLEAAAWYRKESKALAQRFRDAVSKTVLEITANPKGFPVVSENRRRAVVRVFPYLVSFELDGSTIRILAVIHGHRHPRHLENRKRPPERN